MSDIVERLRDRGVCSIAHNSCRNDFVCEKAADEIERLLAERDRLRDAVQWFIDNDETNEGDTPLPEYGGRCWNEINAYYIDGLNRARAALKETGHE